MAEIKITITIPDYEYHNWTYENEEELAKDLTSDFCEYMKDIGASHFTVESDINKDTN